MLGGRPGAGSVTKALGALAVAAAMLSAAGCGGGSTTTVINRTVTQTVPATPTTTRSVRSCPDVANIGPTGSNPADAVHVKTINSDCPTASGLARHFYPTSIRTGARAGDTVSVDGFECRESQVSTVTGVTCVRAASEVTFSLGTSGPPASHRLTRTAAQAAARQAASTKVAGFGITLPPGSWQASCRTVGDVYACGVASNGGQCSGSVIVKSDGNVPTGEQRVGCRE